MSWGQARGALRLPGGGGVQHEQGPAPSVKGQNSGTSSLLESKPFYISIPFSQEHWERPGQESLTHVPEGEVEAQEGQVSQPGSHRYPHLLQLQQLQGVSVQVNGGVDGTHHKCYLHLTITAHV